MATKLRDNQKELTIAEALPCPFCGEQPIIQPWHGGGPRKRMVACNDPFCLVRPAVAGGTKSTALEAWNYRKPTT